MRQLWFGALGASLSFAAAGAWAQEPDWRARQSVSAVSPEPAASLGRPVPAASLGRPVPMSHFNPSNSIQSAEYLNNAQSGDPSMPLLAPGAPPTPPAGGG